MSGGHARDRGLASARPRSPLIGAQGERLAGEATATVEARAPLTLAVGTVSIIILIDALAAKAACQPRAARRPPPAGAAGGERRCGARGLSQAVIRVVACAQGRVCRVWLWWRRGLWRRGLRGRGLWRRDLWLLLEGRVLAQHLLLLELLLHHHMVLGILPLLLQ